MGINRINMTMIVIFLFLLFILGYQLLVEKKDKNNLLRQLSNYEIGTKDFKIKHNADSSTIASQEQTILTEREAYRLGLLKKDDEIKKIKSQVTSTTNTGITHTEVAYVPDNFADTSGWYKKLIKGDNSKDVIDSLRANSIIVPKLIDTTSAEFVLKATIKKSAFSIDSLSFPNKQTVTIGNTGGFFKTLFGKDKDKVTIKNSNSHVEVNAMNNVIIKENKKFYQTRGFWTGVGAALILLLRFAL